MTSWKRDLVFVLLALFLFSLTGVSDAGKNSEAGADDRGQALKKKTGSQEDLLKQQCTTAGKGNKAGGCHNETRLVLVQVIFRHGDRTPLFSWPKDPLRKLMSNTSMAKTFLRRKGMLTKRGMDQAYELGAFLNNRYKEFLKNTWIPEEVRVQSSEVDRTMMTAQYVLSGLFPPVQCPLRDVDALSGTGGCFTNRNMRWQAIPVHQIPKELDNKIKFHPNSCWAYMRLLNNVLGCAAMQQYMENNRKMFDDLKEHTGLPEVNMQNVGLIYDTLFIMDNYGMKMPNWTKGYYPKALRELHELGFQSMSANRQMTRFNGGPLLREVIANMKSSVFSRCYEQPQPVAVARKDETGDEIIPEPEGYGKTKKVQLFSGHDTTVSAFLSAVGLVIQQVPAYTAAVMVELHEPIKKIELDGSSEEEEEKPAPVNTDPTSEYIVKVFYRNGSGGQAEEQSMLKCGNPCTLDKLEKMSKDLYVDNWQTACDGHEGLMGRLMKPFRVIFKMLMNVFSIEYGKKARSGGTCSCR